jgi:hypothetical protein
MTQRTFVAAATTMLLVLGACGGGDDETGSIEEWCALGSTLDEVNDAMSSADFTDPVELEAAMSTLGDALDEMESAAPEEVDEQVDVFVQGNRDFISEFDEVGYDPSRVDGNAAAIAIETYTPVAVELDTFTAGECDDPFVLFDEQIDGTGEAGGGAEGESTVSSTTELELVDAGDSGNRIRLDALPEQGATWVGEMLVDVTLGVNGESNDTPSSIVEMTIEVVETDDDGSYTVASEVTGVRTAPSDDIDEDVLAEYEPRAATMIGTTNTWTVDASGNVGEVTAAYPDDLDPTLTEGLEIGDRASDQLTVPLPDQPVGIGATWTTAQSTDLNGVQSNLTTEYELVDVADDVFTLAWTTTQSLSVADGEATGSGSLRQQIGGLAPIESSTESDGTYEVAEEDGSVTFLRITTSATVVELR